MAQRVTALEDELGDVVAKARVGRGRTTAQLAADAGLTEKDIDDIQSYRMMPDAAVTARIAAALGLDQAKLVSIAEGWSPAPVQLPETVQCVAVPYGGYSSNCYIFIDPESAEAAVIDPGGSAHDVMTLIGAAGAHLSLVLLTHAHGDHTGGLRDLMTSVRGVTVVNHQLERDSVMRGAQADWEPAKDNVSIYLGDTVITPLATPGHTPGSVCYYTPGMCFTGDSLFSGSIGRPSGIQVYKQMLDDLRKKVLSLPRETLLLPGHGPATTVGEENGSNPFF